VKLNGPNSELKVNRCTPLLRRAILTKQPRAVKSSFGAWGTVSSWRFKYHRWKVTQGPFESRYRKNVRRRSHLPHLNETRPGRQFHGARNRILRTQAWLADTDQHRTRGPKRSNPVEKSRRPQEAHPFALPHVPTDSGDSPRKARFSLHHNIWTDQNRQQWRNSRQLGLVIVPLAETPQFPYDSVPHWR
jgi:hypothetical protein